MTPEQEKKEIEEFEEWFAKECRAEDPLIKIRIKLWAKWGWLERARRKYGFR